jgi:hypothetical protein
MSWIGRDRRKYIKGEFEKMSSGAGLVSDRERKAAEKKVHEGTNQALQQQQAQLNRQAQASGPVMAGQMQQQAQQATEAMADAQRQGTIASQDQLSKLEEHRRARVDQLSQQQIENNLAKADRAAEINMRAVEAAGEVLAAIFGMG